MLIIAFLILYANLKLNKYYSYAFKMFIFIIKIMYIANSEINIKVILKKRKKL